MKNLLKYKSINKVSQKIVSAIIPIKKLRQDLRKSLRIMLQKDLIGELHKVYSDYYQFALFWPWGDFNLPLSLLKEFKRKNNKKILIVCMNELQKSIIEYYEVADKIIIIEKNIYYSLFLDFDQNKDTQFLRIGYLYCLSHWLFSQASEQKSYNFLELYAKMLNLNYPVEPSLPNIKSSICEDYSKTVLIYPEANSFSDLELSKDFWLLLAKKIASLGFQVIFNTKSNDYAPYKTTFLPILEQTAMAKQCKFVIGMRSGFSDILAINKIKNHIVVYPQNMYFKTITKEQQEKEFSRVFIIEENETFSENMFRICSLKMFPNSTDIEIKYNGDTSLLTTNIIENIIENTYKTSFLESNNQRYCNCLNIFKTFDKNFQDYIIKNNLYEQIPKLIPHKANDIRIEVNLADHCNLNCKFCDHFSPIAEKRFLDITVFEKDISRLAKLTNGILGGLSLIGGEPLLHSDVSKFFEISRIYFPNTVIDMVTNGILLKNNNEVWKALKKYNIKLLITTYPININYEEIDKKAKDLKIDYERFFMFGTNMKEKVSVHHPFRLDGSVNKNDFIQCYHFNKCITLRNGKLYTCPIIPYSEHFNKYFNQNLIISEKDYIDIYKAKSFDEIANFLATRPEFCKYCDVTKRTEHSYGISKKSISEWT